MTAKENENIMNLQKLKNDYEELSKKYNLPLFTELNKAFDIEDITTETEFLLRKIRRLILEKISMYLRFIEMTLNPSSTPPFLFKKIKKLESSDKETLLSLYEKIGDLEIETLLLDVHYDEEKEAEFIKKTVELTNKLLAEDLAKIIKKLMNQKLDDQEKGSRSYFG